MGKVFTGKRGVEVKEYEGGVVEKYGDVLKEAEIDASLVKDGDWEIEWHFRNCEPSPELRLFLEEAGIKITP